MKVIWLRFAAENLERLYGSLKEFSPKAAATLYNDILDEVAKLGAFPQMAPVESLLAKEPEVFRSLVVCRRYKIVYFIENETVKIVDVWDCRRDPKALVKKTTRKR
jgi:plasmid stabilization system protein ParE